MKTKQPSLHFSHLITIVLSLLLGFSLLAGFKSATTHKTTGKTGTCSLLIVEYYTPRSIAVDAENNLYVVDTTNHRIRKITREGRVSTLAGSDYARREGFADGTGSTAQFSEPRGIVIDKTGNLYVVDTGNRNIRKITPEGVVTTFAGSSTTNSDGWMERGYADGQGNAARFGILYDIAIDAADNLYVVDSTFESSESRIRKVTPKGVVSTLVENSDNTTAEKCGLGISIAIDKAGNLYTANPWCNCIYKITAKGIVTTFAGSNAGSSTTERTRGYVDGQGNAARFDEPRSIAIDKTGNLYVADGMNRRIRKVTPEGVVSTFAGSGGTAYGEDLSAHGSRHFSVIVKPERVEVDGDRDTARFENPYSIAIDKEGNLYVVDGNNPHIRKVTPTGEVITLKSMLSSLHHHRHHTQTHAAFNHSEIKRTDHN